MTGDDETGYLTGPGSDPYRTTVVNNGKGTMPDMQWNSGDHTNSIIPLRVTYSLIIWWDEEPVNWDR